MPTKFPRRRCIVCKSLHVAWKMPSMNNLTGNNRIFMCWSCCQMFYEKLTGLNIQKPPNKRFLLNKAFKLPKLKKAEDTSTALSLFNSNNKKNTS